MVTPGTIIEPAMLDEASNNFLAAVVREEGIEEGEREGKDSTGDESERRESKPGRLGLAAGRLHRGVSDHGDR